MKNELTLNARLNYDTEFILNSNSLSEDQISTLQALVREREYTYSTNYIEDITYNIKRNSFSYTISFSCCNELPLLDYLNQYIEEEQKAFEKALNYDHVAHINTLLNKELQHLAA